MIKNQWYGILPSKELKKEKLVAVKRCGLDLCLFRLNDDSIGCVIDQCTHRGAAISKGKNKGDCIACPFHGIQFDKEGKTVFVPANGKLAHVEERFNVKSYLVKEAHGMVYFWYGDKDKATDDLPYFEEFLKEGMVYSEMSDCWNAHYSRCIENQLDVVHVPFVHYNTIGRGNKTLVNGPALKVEGNTIIFSAYNSLDEGQPQIPASELTVNPNMNLRFKFPNIWQNHISSHMNVVIFFAPIDDEHTMFYIRFYTDMFKLRFMNQLMAAVGKRMNKVIERQDKGVVETQRPKVSALFCGEHLLKGDSPVITYRKMRDDFQKKED